MNWDDLKFALAVAQAGSLSGAAAALGVNHSTVYRRLGALEDDVGARLFDRLPTGYRPTAAGEEMIAGAMAAENEIDRAWRHVSGRDLTLQGSLVVTTTHSLLDRVAIPCLAAFRQRYPDIVIELVVDPQLSNLSKRQADIALRPTARPPETLIGRRVCGLATAGYAASSLLGEARAEVRPAEMDWIAPDDSLQHLASAKWIRRAVPRDRIVFRANGMSGIFAAAESGIGAALLPCFMGDASPRLRRIIEPAGEWRTDLWLLTHEDLRQTARVRAFMDFMAQALAPYRELLEGTGG